MRRFLISTYIFILLAVLVTSFGITWLAEFYISRSYQEAIETANRDISRGCFYLMEKEILAVPEEEYARVVEDLQIEFGYPIVLVRRAELHLTDREQQLAAERKVIVRDEGESLYFRLGDSDYLISMGPFADVDLSPRDTVLIFVAGAFLLGLLVLPWAYLLWRKIVRIGNAAEKFGKGDFTARVELSRFSSLSIIGNTFNSMASQIERLISSHKHLVNAVSHELRTPISRIRFGLEILMDGNGETRDKQLAGIRHDINELDNLVSELLTYSRFERAEYSIDCQELALLPWLREYIALTRESLEVNIYFSSSGVDESLMVKFDPRLLERALHNLLQNGARFAVSGLSVHLGVDGDKNVLITVGDDGPGIAEEDRQRIFEPFTRLESSRNRETGGYGLGLSIVREIVRNHDGSTTVGQSEQGGAAFQLLLPGVNN